MCSSAYKTLSRRYFPGIQLQTMTNSGKGPAQVKYLHKVPSSIANGTEIFSNDFGTVANWKNIYIFQQKSILGTNSKASFPPVYRKKLASLHTNRQKKKSIKNNFCTDFWLASVVLSEGIFCLMLAACCFITLDKFLVPKINHECSENCFIQQGAFRTSPYYSVQFCLPSLAYLYFYTFYNSKNFLSPPSPGPQARFTICKLEVPQA